jgi:hypothetical protein
MVVIIHKRAINISENDFWLHIFSLAALYPQTAARLPL